MLLDFGINVSPSWQSPPDHPALSWVRSGLASVTGRRTGPPLMAPAGLTAVADGALAALAAMAP
ncbi:MAG: hypothetical protein Q8K85_21785, partial [Hyphomicrobium sp.]|nr:hypothetical protein [Hyphomicrobium sp.]